MTFEADLYTVLSAVTPQVFPDFAPVDTPRPYATFQQIGGGVLNLVDNSPPGVRLPDVQVNVWADTRAEAMSVIRAIEDAMRAATAFTAIPSGDAMCDFDADVPVYGAHQDFRCRHTT
jgi:hypothetical protein